MVGISHQQDWRVQAETSVQKNDKQSSLTCTMHHLLYSQWDISPAGLSQMMVETSYTQAEIKAAFYITQTVF